VRTRPSLIRVRALSNAVESRRDERMIVDACACVPGANSPDIIVDVRVAMHALLARARARVRAFFRDTKVWVEVRGAIVAASNGAQPAEESFGGEEEATEKGKRDNAAV